MYFADNFAGFYSYSLAVSVKPSDFQLWFVFFFLLATDFALKVADCPETEYPVKTLSTQQGCLWYRKDDKFKIPKGK